MRTVSDRLCVLIGTGLLSGALLSGSGWGYLEAAAPHPTAAPPACGAPQPAGPPSEWQRRATAAHQQARTRWTEACRVGSRDLQAVLRLEVSAAGELTA